MTNTSRTSVAQLAETYTTKITTIFNTHWLNTVAKNVSDALRRWHIKLDIERISEDNEIDTATASRNNDDLHKWHVLMPAPSPIQSIPDYLRQSPKERLYRVMKPTRRISGLADLLPEMVSDFIWLLLVGIRVGVGISYNTTDFVSDSGRLIDFDLLADRNEAHVMEWWEQYFVFLSNPAIHADNVNSQLTAVTTTGVPFCIRPDLSFTTYDVPRIFASAYPTLLKRDVEIMTNHAKFITPPIAIAERQQQQHPPSPNNTQLFMDTFDHFITNFVSISATNFTALQCILTDFYDCTRCNLNESEQIIQKLQHHLTQEQQRQAQLKTLFVIATGAIHIEK